MNFKSKLSAYSKRSLKKSFNSFFDIKIFVVGFFSTFDIKFNNKLRWLNIFRLSLTSSSWEESEELASMNSLLFKCI